MLFLYFHLSSKCEYLTKELITKDRVEKHPLIRQNKDFSHLLFNPNIFWSKARRFHILN